MSHRKRIERARAKRDAASSAFTTWAIENGFGHVRLIDMPPAIAGHPEGVKLWAAAGAARDALHAAEAAAVEAGAAWRDERGHVQLYSQEQMRRWKRHSRKTFGNRS